MYIIRDFFVVFGGYSIVVSISGCGPDDLGSIPSTHKRHIMLLCHYTDSLPKMSTQIYTILQIILPYLSFAFCRVDVIYTPFYIHLFFYISIHLLTSYNTFVYLLDRRYTRTGYIVNARLISTRLRLIPQFKQLHLVVPYPSCRIQP